MVPEYASMNEEFNPNLVWKKNTLNDFVNLELFNLWRRKTVKVHNQFRLWLLQFNSIQFFQLKISTDICLVLTLIQSLLFSHEKLNSIPIVVMRSGFWVPNFIWVFSHQKKLHYWFMCGSPKEKTVITQKKLFKNESFLRKKIGE